MVPCSLAGSTPCSSATAMYIESNTRAVALMVMEVDTSPSGMRSNSARMSSSEPMLTPTLPTSPRDMG